MTAKGLIAKLQALVDEHGDREVVVFGNYGSYGRIKGEDDAVRLLGVEAMWATPRSIEGDIVIEADVGD